MQVVEVITEDYCLRDFPVPYTLRRHRDVASPSKLHRPRWQRIAAWVSNWCILTGLCKIKSCVSWIKVGWAEETVMKEFNLFKGNNNWTIIGYAFEEGERILTVLYVDRTHIHNWSPGNSSHLYFVETASILRNNLFDDIEFVRLERTCRPVNSLKLIKLPCDIDGVWLPLFAW